MHALATVHIADWVALLTAVATVIAAVGGVVAALHGYSVRQAVRIPSNGVKLGSVVEGISQVQHMLMQLSHPDTDTPSAVAVGRALEQPFPTDNVRSTDMQPETSRQVPAPPPTTPTTPPT